MDNLGRMISFGIEAFAFFQTAVGTKLDTKAATFAAIPDYIDFSMRDGMGFGIERQTPKFHDISPSRKNQVFHSIVFFSSESIPGMNPRQAKRSAKDV